MGTKLLPPWEIWGGAKVWRRSHRPRAGRGGAGESHDIRAWILVLGGALEQGPQNCAVALRVASEACC